MLLPLKMRACPSLPDLRLLTTQKLLQISAALMVGVMDGVGVGVRVGVGGASVAVAVGVHVGGKVGRTKGVTGVDEIGAVGAGRGAPQAAKNRKSPVVRA